MDLALGANHGCSLEGCGETEGDFFTSMGPDAFFGFIRAVQNTFPIPEDGCKVVYEIYNLEHFADIETAVDHLWRCGIRA